MKGLFIQGSWKEDPRKIKKEIQRFFEEKIKKEGELEASLDEVLFNSLNEEDKGC